MCKTHSFTGFFTPTGGFDGLWYTLAVLLRLLDRYLIREIVPYVALCLLLLTSVIFLREANRFSELFIVFSRSGASTGPLFSLILSVLPGILVYTIPISLLIGVLMALGRLSSDSEITAMRASGISRRHLMFPLLIVGLSAAAGMTYLTFELVPQAQQTLSQLKEARGQIVFQGLSTQIKPRVFEESIPGKVFYIQDVDRHTDVWKNLFIADVTADDEPGGVTVYTARSGRLTSPLPGEDLPEFHLFNAQAHTVQNAEERKKVEYQIQDAQKLSIIFESTTAAKRTAEALADAEKPPAVEAMDFGTLVAYQAPADQQFAWQSEINKRFAIPVTVVIFTVIGLAFGVYNQRTGRSFGLVLGLILTTIFYVLTLGGEKSARSGAIPPWLGIWGPNIVFAVFGLWSTLMQRIPRWAQIGWIFGAFARRKPQTDDPGISALDAKAAREGDADLQSAFSHVLPVADRLRITLGFPRIIDKLILSDLARNVFFVTAGMTLIFIVFTIFELIAEIVRNQISTGTVFAYILYLTPQIVVYLTPLAVLVGVMTTFGLMASGSQIVALKASGQSVYRLAVPVFGLALVLSGAMFALQNYVLPRTNRQQEDLRQQIRSGKEPPRTFFQTDRQWIAGKSNRIFYYRHFDPTSDSFAQLSIFDLDPETFQIKRRIYASRAEWNAAEGAWTLQYGWLREFEESRITNADVFGTRQFSLDEGPDYFKRPVSDADKLNVVELKKQIADLSASGFDVLDLRIDLQNKLAFPVTCLIMALVGLPFAFSVGKRGALYGVAVGLGIGLVFWGALGLFTQMGRYELLPPVLAAWGPNMLFGTGGAYLFLTTRT